MQQQLPHNILHRLRESAKLVHGGDSINIVLYDLDKISDTSPEILEYFADDLRQLYTNPFARERAFKLTVKLLNYWCLHRYVCGDVNNALPQSELNAMMSPTNHCCNIATQSVVPSFADCAEIEAPADPEPTDYSQRYKERPVDELTAPRSCNKVTEEVGSEDTVKVYQTEGTPLNFSLASSLTDLRETGLLRSIHEENNDLNCVSIVDAGGGVSDNSNILIDSSSKPLVMKRPVHQQKPVPPPKPPNLLDRKALLSNSNHSNGSSNDLINNNKIETNNGNNSNKCVTFDTRIQHSISDDCVVSSLKRAGVGSCCDETPLMFSRCSSLESLSSCGVKSLCCDSSVVSEFSRRASEVVSPSDLPDSPFEELVEPLDAKPVAQPRGVKLEKSDVDGGGDAKVFNAVINSGDNDNVFDINPINVFDDTAVNYAMEGTQSGALSISLSSLCTGLSDVKLEFDENQCCSEDLSNNNNNNNVNNNNSNDFDGQNANSIAINGQNFSGAAKSVDVSSEDENEEELLACCISLGMKKQFDDKANNTILCYNSRQSKPPQQHHQTSPQNHDSIRSPDNVMINMIGKLSPVMATKPNTLNLASPIVPPKPMMPYIRVGNRSSPDGRVSYLESDSVRAAYRTREHNAPTIATLSRSTSTSEFQLQDQTLSSLMNHNDESSSSGDDDEHALLQRCIESGMSNHTANNSKHRKTNGAKKTHSPSSNNIFVTGKKVSPITPKTTPNISPNACLLSDGNHNRCKPLDGDQMKHFFVEDTPVLLSKCHSSLSSLSFDSDDDNDFENQRLLQDAISSGMKMKTENSSGNQLFVAAPRRRPNNNNSSKFISQSKSDDELIDDKTYTICNQNERKNQIKAEANKMIDSVIMMSTVSAMTDSSCGGLSDLESTKPPSLMNSTIMMSSCESASFSSINHLPQQHKQIPIPKPRRSRSANYLKSTAIEDKPLSFIDDVKPPSLMNDISLLSQSFDASVSSDISDISLDFIDIVISKSNENVANAAINCARELNTLTVSCNNAANTFTELTDRIDRIEPPSVFHRINDISKLNTEIPKLNHIKHANDYDMSDTEVSEELPIDAEDIVLAMKQQSSSNRNSNHFEHSFTSSSATLLPLESPTVCADLLTSDFDSDENQRILTDRQRYLETFITECDKIMEQSLTDDTTEPEDYISASEKRMAPIGSEDFASVDDDEQLSLVSGAGAGADDENDDDDDDNDDDSELDSRATYNVSVTRRARIVKPVARKSKASKELQQHYLSGSPKMIRSSMSKPLQSVAHHRCVVKGTRTSALRASRSRSVDYHYDSGVGANDEAINNKAAIHQEKTCANNGNNNNGGSHKQHYRSTVAKQCIVYVNEEQFNGDITHRSSSNGRSHANTLSHQPMNGNSNTKEEKSSSRKDKERSLFSNMRSKLTASLSSHNLGSTSNVSQSSSSSNGFTPVTCSSFSRKLEVQSRIASLWKRSKSASNDKTSDYGSSISSVAKTNLSKTLDLTRSVVCRRSFAKSSKSSAKLTRSSTFEKLPQSGEEAALAEEQQLIDECCNNGRQHESKKCVQHYSGSKNNANNNNGAYKTNSSFSKKRNNAEAHHNSDKLNSNLMSTSTPSAKYMKNSPYFSNNNNNNVNNMSGQRITNNNGNSNAVNNNVNVKSSKKNSGGTASGGKSRRTILVTAV